MNRSTSTHRAAAVTGLAAAVAIGLGATAATAQAAPIAAAPAAATSTAAAVSAVQGLEPGPAPTAVPASVTRRLLGTVASTNDGTVAVTVRAAGRYTLEYRTTLPGGFNNVVDGTVLQQTGVGSNSIGYSQTFFLSRGTHTVRLGGPQVDGPAKEYLVGRL